MSGDPTLAFAFATIDRPQVAQRLIKSIRANFGNTPIYVADQSAQVEAMMPFYAAHNVTVFQMPYDIGVTASRNCLARHIKEELFLLCDDDFIIAPETNISDAVHILKSDTEIAVVGGRLYDFDGRDEWLRNWEMFLLYDKQQKILTSIPIYQFAPKIRELGHIRYYLCDAVMNFALFRRSVFSDVIRWDEQFKSNGEHEDFFLTLKVHSSSGVAYLPTMLAYHHHPAEYRGYRMQLRDRNEGWRRFLTKWGLEQHVEIGLGVRTLDDVATITSTNDAKARFFMNPDGSLHRSDPMPNGLLVGNFETISAVGALNERGLPTTIGAPARGVLLLNSETRQVVAMPAPSPALPARPKSGTERYQLGAPEHHAAVSSTNDPICFRYNALIRSDKDFYLWYAATEANQTSSGGPQRLAVTIRWFGSDNTSLVWKTRRQFLDLQQSRYWHPLIVDVPVVPSHCRWLRFDVVTDGGPSPNPICTGFLFKGSLPLPGQPSFGSDVLALSRLPNDGAASGVSGRDLHEVIKSCPRRDANVIISDYGRDISLLCLDETDRLEVLFFVGWEGLGRPLVSARLRGPEFGAPTALAIPSELWKTPDAILCGYGRATGMVVLKEGLSKP